MNPRTPISELRLQGSPNMRRALDREKADAERPPLTAAQQAELARIDELIDLAMKACKRGQTLRGRRNPSFANLELLTRVRAHLLAQRDKPDTQKDLVSAEIDDAITKAAKAYAKN